MSDRPRTFLRFRTVTERYPLSTAKLRKMVFQRQIPFHKVDRNLFFDEADILSYFEAGRVPARKKIP